MMNSGFMAASISPWLYEDLGYESFNFVVYLRKKLQPEEVDTCGH